MKRVNRHKFSAWFGVSVCVLTALTLALFLNFTLNASPSKQASSFIFTAVGDYGANANTNLVLAGIAGAGANFHLALGDLKYDDLPTETDWCNYVSSYVGTTFPFELGAGNHEMDGQGTQGHINNFALCLPDRLGGLNGVYAKQYYFDYQNLARIIYISPALNLDGETYSYNVGSARYNWLSNAIDSARTANLPWVIVAMHKNCISTGTKSCEIGTDLFNLLVNKKVDLVLQGHEHNYQRSKQLAHSASCSALAANAYNAGCVADDGTDNFYSKGAGSVLVVSGAGGRPVYGSNPSDSEAGYFANYVAPGDTARYGFTKVTVSSTQLVAQFVTVSAGTFTDAFTIGSSPPPTTLASFTARAVPNSRVRVKWTTTDETNVIGFNVWHSRRAKGTFEKINAAPINAKQTGHAQGASYRFVNHNVVSGRHFYKLEILYADGSVQWSEIVKVKVP